MNLPVRKQVFEIEKLMLQQEQVALPVAHHFSEGVYARELQIPKGTILTGAIHKYPQLNLLIKGELSVLTETGIERVKAPFIVVSPAGTKRIAYAHEDSVWVTVHPTTEKDVDVIEQKFIAKSEPEWLEFSASQDLIGAV